ncbi:Importin-5 [Biomphalaria glabrata]|uniref:Importin-5-like n=1 Tax=Biomphalaria glabrata TaxID=6526 RepID=A0A9W2YYI7_BIOGL|nr:importin-5-like [Biomphalaria glabrata]KAI8751607.1 importin-5 [Biomphalaria glabrata]
MAGPQDIQALLHGLMSSDNEIRTQSEQAYENVPAPDKVVCLIQAIRKIDIPVEQRALAALLLRRLFTNNFETLWPQISLEIQNGVKQELMAAIHQEEAPNVRRKVCDAFSELVRNMIDDDNNMQWPEALKFLFECASSENPALKESALHILSSVPGIFGNQQNQYIEVIKQMLGAALMDRSHPAICFEAVKAVTAFLVNNDKELGLLNHFRDLLPLVIQGVADSITTQEDDSLLKCLIELSENVPKYLRSHIESVFELCLGVVANANLEDTWRQLALEVIVTMSETAPAMVRKLSKFIPLLVQQVLALMVDLEDDPEWSIQDIDDDEDTDSNPIAGEAALDRLACALGGKTMLPHIISNISQMLQHADWQYRYAGLMAVSACGEGCHTHMEQMLNNIVDAVLPFAVDPHPRVRYAACNALGQLCTDFGPNCQKKFHNKIVPALVGILDDEANPRVQAHGAAALVNFSEECPKHLLVQYLDVIILKLEQVLTHKFREHVNKGNKLVLEQVITTLASVADTAQDKFLQYYDRFMPCLKYIMQHIQSSEHRLLRGKTIECISLIGLAVGKEKFMQDCNDVMQLLLKTQTEEDDLADDDPQITYMISAWARMCKILGKEFEQYLPLVMGPVLKAASLKPEVALIDSEDMKDMENSSDWQFVTLGDQQNFGICTAGLEEKATACQMLVCYARELKEGFAAYSEEVVKIMVPLLKFYFNDTVRIAATESLPYLLDCAKIQGEQYVANMWAYICPHLLKAIEIEPEQSVLPEYLGSFAKCVESLGKGCLNDQDMSTLVTLLDKLLKQHFVRQNERQDKRKDEDYDDIVEESLMDEDDEDAYVLSKIADIIHSFFGTHKESFLPVYEQIMPYFVKLLSPERPWSDRQWALCVWDDVIEHTGPISHKYREFFLEQMIQSITDKTPEIRQAASYGLGVIGQFGGDVYADVCAESIPRLVSVIEHAESKEVENLPATDNAISAVVKICQYNGSKVNVDELLYRLVSWLPILTDEEEAVHVYTYFCDLLDKNHPAIMGENASNLPQVISIVAETLHRELVQEDTPLYMRLVNIVRQVQSNPDVFQVCVSQLTEQQRQALIEI